jgi:hypothetical protein
MISRSRMSRPALLAAAALTAVAILASFAGAAQAKQWYTGAKEELLKGSTATTMSLTESAYPFERGPLKGKTAKEFHIGWTWGTGSNTIEILMSASGAECVECKVTNESPKAGVAQGTGRIKLTGVTVVEPAGCSVSGSEKGTLISRPLFWEVTTVSGKEFVRFYPTTAGAPYLSFFIDCGGITGNYNITGTLFAQNTGSPFSKNSTLHDLSFTEAIQKEAGGHLTTGSYPITFEGTLSEALTSGLSWMAK